MSEPIETEGAAPAPSPGLGLGRLVGVLTAPEKTFRSIAARPTWILALVVVTAASLFAGWAVADRTDPEEMVEGQLEMMGQDDLPPEKVEEMVEQQRGRSPAVMLGIGGAASVAVFFLVAFFFWGAFRLLGSEIEYRQSAATLVHAWMPLAIAALLNLPLVLSRRSLTFEEASTGGYLLTSSLAAFAPEDASRVVETLLASVDFFTIWTLVLLVIGYRVVAGVSRGAALGTVLTLWLAWVGLKVGFTALMSSFAKGAGA